jgi:hypothetical protein
MNSEIDLSKGSFTKDLAYAIEVYCGIRRRLILHERHADHFDQLPDLL